MSTASITLEPGVHRGLSFPRYLALRAWGSSSVKAMRRGPPARVLWERENPREDTDDTKRGSAVHCLVLTPELYGESYVHKPEGMNFSTKEGKAWRDDPEREGKKIITYDEALLVGGAAKAVLQKDTSGLSLMEASDREVTFLWECPISGELCKGRPDWLEGRYVNDLKVTRHAEGGLRSLAYRAFSEGWMHQLAHNRTGAQALGLDIRGGRIVAVTPKPPHFVYCLEVKADALDLLEIENIATLKAMAECRESGVWEDTSEGWEKIEPPAAALVEFGEMCLEPEEA